MSKSFLCGLLLSLFLGLSASAQTNNSVGLLKQVLDLPAPAPKNADEKNAKKERGEDFFSDEKIPSDDAPVEDLVDYWTSKNGEYNRLKYQVKPTPKTIEKILEYCEDNPQEIGSFLNVFPTDPDVADKVKKIYDSLAENAENTYLRTTIKQWLKFNSKYYVDELINEAQKIQDRENYVQNDDQAILRALAKVDWDSARPIIDRLEYDPNQPYAAILAKWVVYQHAIDTGDSSTIERYRSDLQKIVENKTAAWAERDLAMDSLVMSGDWDGRDEWYMSLLEDETLLTIQDNGYTGLTTIVAMSPPKKWAESMIKLTKSSNLSVRSAAVRNLMDIFTKDRQDILEALLPWLTDESWAKASNNNERISLIAALAETIVPEAVPGLISVVQNESDAARSNAAKALVKYKDARANSALRFALQQETNQEFRQTIVEALVACGGISDDEQMSGLEVYATIISTPEGLEKMQAYNYENYEGDAGADSDQKPLPLPVLIGKFVSEQEEPGEGLVTKAIARLKVLKRTKPLVAKSLAEIMEKWKGRAMYLEALRQIKAGEADTETILMLLANRKNVREKIPNDVAALSAANGIQRGIGACLAEDPSEFTSILGQTDTEAQVWMLSCARLIRAALPIEEVGAMLKNQNKTLALAAERYLETEDSTQARSMILAQHPNEAVILGARQAFIPNTVKSPYNSPSLDALFASVTEGGFPAGTFPEISRTEENLRSEIKQDADLLAVYAILPEAASGQQVLRVFKDKAIFTIYEDEARFRERNLTSEEYESFYNFLLENKIDSLAGFNETCEDCTANEFIMFGRGGGRRVYYQDFDGESKALDKLKKFFESFAEGETTLRYRLSGKINGLEVLLADKNLNALAIWKKDSDFRVLIEDKAKKEEIEKNLSALEEKENQSEETDSTVLQNRYEAQQKRRREQMFDHFAWRKFEGGKLGEVSSQPLEAAFLPNGTNLSQTNEEINFSEPYAWQVRAGDVEIRTGTEGGLFKITRSQSAVKLKQGIYKNPIVSLDGKWVVAAKTEMNRPEPVSIMRVNLQTGAEFKVNIPFAETLIPIAATSQNKILLFRARQDTYIVEGKIVQYGNDEYSEQADKTKINSNPKVPEYYLLDASTGALQLVKGEVQPLLQQTYRPLQPTTNAGEFWAAIYDEKTKTTQVGRYADKTFSFLPVLQIPEINLSSMQIWVDEKEAKVYFVYEGHLLALPIK
jgi:HEAT repeat protein